MNPQLINAQNQVKELTELAKTNPKVYGPELAIWQKKLAQYQEHAIANSPEAAALLQSNPAEYMRKYGSPTDIANLDRTLALKTGGATGYAPAPQSTSVMANQDGIAPTVNPQTGGATGYAPASQVTPVNLGNVNLTRGSKGEDVKRLQEALNASGIGVNLKLDGDFGPATEAAVRAYQTSKGIKSDGIVGPQTIATLGGTPNAPLGPVNEAITNTTSSNPLYNSLTSELKSLFDTLTLQISTLVEQGQRVNPDLEITPQMTARFLEEATNELDPYYKELIRQNKQDLSVSFRTLQEDYAKNVGREQPAFEQTLENQDITEANQGTAFSSGRVERENQIVSGQQNRLDDLFNTSQRSLEEKARLGERQVGSRNFADLGIPSLQSYAAGRTISPRGSITSTGSRSAYTPESNLFGELPAQAKTAISTRASGLEETERKKRILDFSGGGGLGNTSLG